ncbi:DNA repair exonuclease [Candidatus Micrarchaeota archaeon]|nr:DNA repair exonuclease [Candidatus Micrarchaeota archaeon]
MARFAHIADVHLGAFRDGRLRELNLQAFERAMDECAKRDLDFVIIAGDLFDINIPDLAVVERAVRKMRQLGKPIYAVYGSHDYSPTQTSVIDVLHEAGVLQKVSSGVYHDIEENGQKKQKLRLDVITDPKTGVKITGISARKLGLEKTYFQDLDAAALESLPGPKIFVFHCAIQEHKPENLQRVDAVPLSLFPNGFDYYAGGHVHARLLTDGPSGNSINGNGKANIGKITYPGPLSAADFRDLEENATLPHGFYVVELGVDGAVAEFVPIPMAKIQLVRIVADGVTAVQANGKVQAACLEAPSGDVALLHARGMLSEGKSSDINWTTARQTLEQKCPIIYVNNALETKERQSVRIDAEKPDAIAEHVFRETLADRDLPAELKGDAGVKLGLDLLAALREENPGDNKKRWDEMVAAKAEKILGIDH